MIIRPKVQVLRIPGRIDRSTGRWLEHDVRDRIHPKCDRIAIDLRNVESIDSIGLAILAETAELTRQLGGEMALFNVQPAVQTLLEITRIHRAIDIFENEVVAITRMAGPATVCSLAA
jgi:anti-anti-sigma factor